MSANLLPPGSTVLERSLADASARLSDVPVPIRSLWDPATCPASLLPFLAWGVSIDLWDSQWSEAEKRAAIARAIEDQRRKGTPASLRSVIDRFDPLISLVEWFEDRTNLEPHWFRLELPLLNETEVEYSDELVLALLRDIAAVKPLRSHMQVAHRLAAQAIAFLMGGAIVGGFNRVESLGDLGAPLEPIWTTYLETELGEPMSDEAGELLEAS